MSPPFTLIHISDLHVHRLPRRPGDWLSKRGVGALNLLLRRAREHPIARARRMVEVLEAMEWNHLVITGDLTQLALDTEFERLHNLLSPLLARGPERITVLPGNHDRYVDDAAGRAAQARLFGAYFGGAGDSGEGGATAAIGTKRLTEHWWLAAWDSTRVTRAFDATGLVRPETLRATEAWIAGLPPGARVIVANHYPVATPTEHPSPHLHDLVNREEVLAWLQSHPVTLYLHGHVHHNWTMTLPGLNGGLRIVNSASTTRVPRPTDRSAFHRITLRGTDAEIEPMRLESSTSSAGTSRED